MEKWTFILITAFAVSASRGDFAHMSWSMIFGLLIIFFISWLMLRPFFAAEPESECRELVHVSKAGADESLDQSVAFRLGKALKRVWRGKRIGPAPTTGDDLR